MNAAQPIANLMSGDDFRESLRRYKPRVFLDGQVVASVADEPGFAPGSDFSYLPPDYVERMTARIPLGRNSEPGDAAGMVMYLSSQAASYITGAVISCDGGNSIGTYQPATNS